MWYVHEVQAQKHVDQFILGSWLATVTERPCHLTTLTVRALSYKLGAREAIFQGLLAYYTKKIVYYNYLVQKMIFIFT